MDNKNEVNIGEQLSGGTNRHELYYAPDRKVVYKLMSAQEVGNLQLVNRYSDEFVSKGIIFPKIYQRCGNPQFEGIPWQATGNQNIMVGMEVLPGFEPYHVREHFGEFDFDVSNWGGLFTAFDTVNDVLHSDFVDKTVFPSDEEEFNKVLLQVDGYYQSAARIIDCTLPESKQVIKRTRSAIHEIPLQAALKDPNPSNWRIMDKGEQPQIGFVDLERLGLARAGWDEGRNYSLLALDPNKQNSFLDSMVENRPSWKQSNWDYFWRVVHLRCLRELTFIQTGKYADSLQYYCESNGGTINRIEEEISDSLNRILRDSMQRV